jgi:hypothetical protein
MQYYQAHDWPFHLYLSRWTLRSASNKALFTPPQKRFVIPQKLPDNRKAVALLLSG